MSGLTVTPADPGDPEVGALLDEAWGETVVGHGTVYRPRELPVLACRDATGRLVGAVTYHLDASGLEVVTINARPRGGGAGTALLAAAAGTARAHGRRRVWLVTTNDNLDALRFYQRRGMRLVALRPGAVDAARRLKPGIPAVGAYGIPLRDELELELPVESAPDGDRRVSVSSPGDRGYRSGYPLTLPASSPRTK